MNPAARFLEGIGAALPIVQAPMAGAGGTALAVAAIRGGALGSLPCALLTPEQVRAQVGEVRAAVSGPLNLNFFCHRLPAPPDDTAWRALLAPYYAEEEVTSGDPPPLRLPFDDAMCAVIEGARPEVVSFHFGLPDAALLARVKTVAKVFGNATTAEEAAWLAARGCDAIIAQGEEAGGHAGWFLDRHRPTPIADLLPVVAATGVPAIAAGGIVDAAGIRGALAAGAAAVQVGTAYLATPESAISAPHRALLGTPDASDAAFTNLLSGREARGIRNRLMRELGPMRDEAPAFPYASNALAPLRAKAEAEGSGDYSPLWAGTGAARVQAIGAEALTRMLGQEKD
ncbi:nitronate monooxygenase family protein [Sphingomonas sp. HF-S4]|uniref:Propionate 3-nitronate monooxygenase n=1 Tax=Sphingomonas agrestis TaxID=3080540 RepID=A0ABU3YD78_9SPHN|nr:nitronate monooxygenase family protein [Sphingomonas sp. HF-S4]MDV3459087.1 nitronate monooxygenase family protein [Sphingomonas sp. HF-S4]